MWRAWGRTETQQEEESFWLEFSEGEVIGGHARPGASAAEQFVLSGFVDGEAGTSSTICFEQWHEGEEHPSVKW